ncbi:MAG: NAD(P)H-hydrate dehydratase [Oscillospiraceae bacterium]|jgi:NAD(P)H-hydrate epimerase|nr:NAD(P)H-hydrate dehydratase [Oscillospiraceae bacterium]
MSGAPVGVDAAFARRLPRRPADTHKGDYGKAFLLCGSEGYTGAARLSAEACLRAGAGLVCLGVPARVYPILAAACPPEIMCRPLPDDGAGRLSRDALPALRERMAWCDAALAGPGLGRSEDLDLVIRTLRAEGTKPLLLDADGLNAVSGHILVRPGASDSPLILTPHDGEFARLGGAAGDRTAAVRALARDTGAVVVRKGHVTLTAAPDGRVYANTTGNPGMAKGGSGDVLAGLLVGLMAQKAAAPALWAASDWAELAACAVFWHGLSGDRCAAARGMYGMTPSDLSALLPAVLDDFIE